MSEAACHACFSWSAALQLRSGIVGLLASHAIAGSCRGVWNDAGGLCLGSIVSKKELRINLAGIHAP